MDENYIRRERQQKVEIQRAVAELRSSLKVCDMDDVRRHKMPYDEALLIGLEEKGYFLTTSFIQQLIDLQTDMKEKAGPSSMLWFKPQLKQNKGILKIISESLVKAEDYMKIEDHAKECEEFIKIATHIAFLHQDWWWLGEQLLLQSINTGKEYPFLEGKYEAIGRYVYAKFLIENFKEIQEAQDHLSLVRELSNGKKWTPVLAFPDEKDLLYTKANYLLYVCLMQEAKSYMKTDNDKAIQLATLARKRAAEACYREGETRALLLKGACEMTCRRTSAAIVTFTKACAIQERLANIEGVCTAKLQLAQAYLLNGDALPSLKTLLAVRNCSEDNHLLYFLAQSYRSLGEFYLNNGEPKKATPLLGEALKILHTTENIRESEQVRNLEAISAGLELFPRFLKLLGETDHPQTGMESLIKMIDWKDSRQPFWELDDYSEDSSPHESDEDSKAGEEEQPTRLSTPDETHGETVADENDVIQLHTNIEAFKSDSCTDLNMTEEEALAMKEKRVTVTTQQSGPSKGNSVLTDGTLASYTKRDTIDTQQSVGMGSIMTGARSFLFNKRDTYTTEISMPIDRDSVITNRSTVGGQRNTMATQQSLAVDTDRPSSSLNKRVTVTTQQSLAVRESQANQPMQSTMGNRDTVTSNKERESTIEKTSN